MGVTAVKHNNGDQHTAAFRASQVGRQAAGHAGSQPSTPHTGCGAGGCACCCGAAGCSAGMPTGAAGSDAVACSPIAAACRPPAAASSPSGCRFSTDDASAAGCCSPSVAPAPACAAATAASAWPSSACCACCCTAAMVNSRVPGPGLTAGEPGREVMGCEQGPVLSLDSLDALEPMPLCTLSSLSASGWLGCAVPPPG